MLIAGGGAVAAVGALPARRSGTPIARQARQLVAAQPWARGMLSLADGSYDEWLAQVGSVFSLGGGTRFASPASSRCSRPARARPHVGAPAAHSSRCSTSGPARPWPAT